MALRLPIELSDQEGVEAVLQAVASYKERLRGGIRRTNQHLDDFERRYGVTTARFLAEMAAEDLSGGDVEYVEWAGEAKLLAGLEGELSELEHAHYQLP